MEHKKKKVFIEGPISAEFIAQSIAKHSSQHKIGAHSIFLGQIRNDEINGRQVKSIEYSAYTDLAEDIFHTMREDAFKTYNLTCMHIYHSLGDVRIGEISLFVFTSSVHRKDAMEACSYLVERIKKEVPIWGKEIFEDNSHQWKENK